MALILNNITVHSVQLDGILENRTAEWTTVRDLVTSGIRQDVVRPLAAHVYDKGQLQSAFRHLEESGSGKVLLKVGY